MRELTDALLDAQTYPPLREPVTDRGAPRYELQLHRNRAGVRLLQWENIPYPAAEGQTYDTNTDYYVFGANWAAQRIEKPTKWTVGYFQVRMWRMGSPGTCYIELYATDENDKPTGSALRSESFNGNNLTDEPPGDLVLTDLLSYQLEANACYCIVIRAPNADGVGNILRLNLATEDFTYDYYFLTSSDAGANWTVYSQYRMCFYIHPVASPINPAWSYFTQICAGDGSLFRAFGLSGFCNLIYQRIADPDTDSAWDAWLRPGIQVHAVALAAYGTHVLLFYRDWAAPRHIYLMDSDDYGATFAAPVDLGYVSSTDADLAACAKPDGTILIIYQRGTRYYAAKRVDDVWGSEMDSGKDLDISRGISIAYQDDFNVMVAGYITDDILAVWTFVFGDGNQAPVNTWTPWKVLISWPWGSNYGFFSPSLDVMDVMRLAFLEGRGYGVVSTHQFWSHGLPDTHFIDNLFLEPAPFPDIAPEYYFSHLVLTHDDEHAWFCDACGIYRADLTEQYWFLTTDMLDFNESRQPDRRRSSLSFTLDNTAGKFNDFDKLGFEVRLGLGYQTVSGAQYVSAPYYWVKGYELRSPPWFLLRSAYPAGIEGTIRVDCEGIWDILDRWRPRRPIEWEAGDASIEDILRFIFARVGFKVTTASASALCSLLKPEFKVTAGMSGKTAVKKLLAWVQDQLLFREATVHLIDPRPTDASVYKYHSTYVTYGPRHHLVYRGNYGTALWNPNFADVQTDAFMAEWQEAAQLMAAYDRRKRQTTPEVASQWQATSLASALVRKGGLLHGVTGWCQVPTNVGQENWDIINITDQPAGVTSIYRRVIGIQTRFDVKTYSYWQVLRLGLR